MLTRSIFIAVDKLCTHDFIDRRRTRQCQLRQSSPISHWQSSKGMNSGRLTFRISSQRKRTMGIAQTFSAPFVTVYILTLVEKVKVLDPAFSATFDVCSDRKFIDKHLEEIHVCTTYWSHMPATMCSSKDSDQHNTCKICIRRCELNPRWRTLHQQHTHPQRKIHSPDHPGSQGSPWQARPQPQMDHEQSASKHKQLGV